MAIDSTTNYGFGKPINFGSTDNWGVELNQSFDDIDATLDSVSSISISESLDNYILNPCFYLSQQRGPTQTVDSSDMGALGSPGSTGIYYLYGPHVADNWMFVMHHADATLTVDYSRNFNILGETGFNNRSNFSGKLSVNTPQTSGVDYLYLTQHIEGRHWQQIRNLTNTLSFLVKTNLTGTYGLALWSTDQSRQYITEYSVSSTDWESVSITIPPDTTSGGWEFGPTIGVYINFVLHASAAYTESVTTAWFSPTSGGTVATKSNLSGPFYLARFSTAGGLIINDTWPVTATSEFEITQVQLVPGGSAPSYRARPLDEEVRICERYYEKSYNMNVQPGHVGVGTTSHVTSPAGQFSWLAPSGSSTFNRGLFNYYTEKRIVPTTTIYDGWTGSSGNISNSTGTHIISGTVGEKGRSYFSVRPGAGGSNNTVYLFHWEADAQFRG